MENASKALLIAGGVLIALLIIALLVYSFGSMGSYFKQEESTQKAEQLADFNNQFESYNRKLLRGVDVISIINKVLDNNKKYGPNEYNEPNYLMQVEFELKEAIGDLEPGRMYNIADYNRIKQNQEDFTEFKRKIFDCKEVRYHNQTGRVNYISFTQREQNY